MVCASRAAKESRHAFGGGIRRLARRFRFDFTPPIFSARQIIVLLNIFPDSHRESLIFLRQEAGVAGLKHKFLEVWR
jgi:hypothetical protein